MQHSPSSFLGFDICGHFISGGPYQHFIFIDIMNIDEPFREIQFQIDKIKKPNRNTDLIQPWMDEPQTIPLYLLKTQSQKFVQKPPKIRKHVSLEIYPKSFSISPRKDNRTSKELPKKNIGNFTIVKIIHDPSKTKQIIRKKRQSEISFPTLSVARELAIERKLFLMKSKDQSQSPQRRSIRQIVDSRFRK